eukprot:Polyplicarium_translucidae@DN2439_c0_g1_i2.p3
MRRRLREYGVPFRRTAWWVLLRRGSCCTVLLPNAEPPGTIGHYTFDMVRPLDESGERNHMRGEIMPGAPVGGKGSSAMFRNSHGVVPHSASFDSMSDFSFTFWMHIMDDEAAKENRRNLSPEELWCPSGSYGIPRAVTAQSSSRGSSMRKVRPLGQRRRYPWTPSRVCPKRCTT